MSAVITGYPRNDLQHVVDQLVDALGPDAVLTSPEERLLYSLDFSEEPGATALAVVKPKTLEQVTAIVCIAGAAGVAVNTRGGGVSYTKGHVPTRPETVILDATGLNRVIEVNTVDRYVTLETGVRWVDLRAALQGTGFRVPYLGTLSGNFATVGGGLSQNATGMGRMTLAEHVLGLEVVLGDGRILKTGSWATKGTAPFYRYNGPDLTGMFLCDFGRVRHQDQGAPVAGAMAEDVVRLRHVQGSRRRGRGAGRDGADRAAH